MKRAPLLLLAIALTACGGSADEPSTALNQSTPAVAPGLVAAATVAPAAAAVTQTQGTAPARASAPTAAAAAGARPVDPYARALVHPRTQQQAAAEYLNGVNLFFDTKEEMLEAVAAYAAANPRLQVIRGYGWNAEAFGGAPPSALELDGAVRDRPVILLSADLRSAWRNSRAAGSPIAPATSGS